MALGFYGLTYSLRDLFPQPYVCHHCGAEFRNRTNWRQHNEQYHAEAKKHKCDDCGKEFRLRLMFQPPWWSALTSFDCIALLPFSYFCLNWLVPFILIVLAQLVLLSIFKIQMSLQYIVCPSLRDWS